MTASRYWRDSGGCSAQNRIVDHDSSIEAVRRHYAVLGEDEWSRLAKDIRGRVGFEVHRDFLRRNVPAGSRVLEVGAGPGRFTRELAALQCRVVVTDLSPVQLELNERFISGTDAERWVESRELLDVCDTARFADAGFDVVLAFGGALSYAFDRAESAMRGLLQAAGAEGVVVASVMSTLGSWRHLLADVVDLAERVGEDAADAALRTGDLRHVQPTGEGHICRMFRWSELRELVGAAGGTIHDACASNWASLGDPETLTRLEADPDRWARFLRQEVHACREPGTLDGGTHIIFAAGRDRDATTR